MATVAVPPALVALLIGAFAGVVVGIAAFVVVAAVVAAWVLRGAESRVRRAIGGRQADPQGEARALNLLEGLSFTAGLKPPELVVVGDDAANVAVWGRRPATAVVAVTSGLLATLNRIELEGVLAAALASVRQGELGPATVAAGLPGVGRRVVASAAGRDEVTDAEAVRLTRFPPGLAGALDAIAARGSAVSAGGPDRAHLWLVDPAPPGEPTPGRSAPGVRAEALREL